jgi:hypothetical protein
VSAAEQALQARPAPGAHLHVGTDGHHRLRAALRLKVHDDDLDHRVPRP